MYEVNNASFTWLLQSVIRKNQTKHKIHKIKLTQETFDGELSDKNIDTIKMIVHVAFLFIVKSFETLRHK